MQEFLNMFNDIEDPEERGMAKGVVGGLLGGFAIIYVVVAIIWVVLAIIALWKIFVRAWEKWWKAIIPIYNVYIMYKIVGMKNWFWYSILVPVALWIVAALLEKSSPDATPILSAIWSAFSGIVGIVASFKLPRKFGWGVGTSVLYVLFTAICLLILGFGNYEYNMTAGKKFSDYADYGYINGRDIIFICETDVNKADVDLLEAQINALIMANTEVKKD